MISTYLFNFVAAQNISNPALGELGNMSGPEFFGNLIPALLSLGLVLGVIIFLFYLILGAIYWISSGGDKMKMEQAKSKITTAIVGLVILLSFIAILNLVECFFGIGLREVTVGPFNINFTGALNCGGGSGSGGCGVQSCGPGYAWCGDPYCFCSPTSVGCPF